MIGKIKDFAEWQGTLVQEEDFEQVPVHHLTKRDLLVNGEVILYIGQEAVFGEHGGKYIYTELPENTIKEIHDYLKL